MIPGNIKEYFKSDPCTFDFKKQIVPEYKHPHELVNWILYSSGWPYFPVTLPNAPYSEMLKEAKALETLFNPHRIDVDIPSEYNNRGWSSLCLHGESWNKTDHWASYEENKFKTQKDIIYDWCEEITQLCPITTKYFKEQFPYVSYDRLRFMYLAPGGYIQQHVDRDTSLLSPINISLNNPEGCIFRMKDLGDVPFSDNGGACLVDISNPHSVWNNSDIPRIHIIVHGIQSQEFNDVVYNSYINLIKK